MTKLTVSDKGQKRFIIKYLYVQDEQDITWSKSIRNINYHNIGTGISSAGDVQSICDQKNIIYEHT